MVARWFSISLSFFQYPSHFFRFPLIFFVSPPSAQFLHHYVYAFAAFFSPTLAKLPSIHFLSTRFLPQIYTSRLPHTQYRSWKRVSGNRPISLLFFLSPSLLSLPSTNLLSSQAHLTTHHCQCWCRLLSGEFLGKAPQPSRSSKPPIGQQQRAGEGHTPGFGTLLDGIDERERGTSDGGETLWPPEQQGTAATGAATAGNEPPVSSIPVAVSWVIASYFLVSIDGFARVGTGDSLGS